MFSDLNFSYTVKMNISTIILISLFLFSCARNIQHRTQPRSDEKSSIKIQYNRKEWRHWTDKDNDCLDTRSEILSERSLKKVKMNARGCVVKEGLWEDYYYPETHTVASRVDIDHLVPLKHAHDSGAHSWSAEFKEKFANDPQNLVITNRSYNRKKGAKGIDEWLPRHQDYACKYVADWIKVKKKYSLRMNTREIHTVESLRGSCRF